MTINHPIKNQQVEVLETLPAFTALPAPIYTVVSPPASHGLRTAFFSGAALALGLAATLALGWVITEARERQETLQQALAHAQSLHVEEQRNLQSVVTQLDQAMAERNQALAALEAERALLAEWNAAQPSAETPAPKTRSRVAPRTVAEADTATQTPAPAHHAEGQPGVATPSATPAPSPGSPLAKAIDATQQLAATEVSEPPSLETIKAHIKAGDPLVATNKDAAKAERSPVMKFLTHPIFIDSAVLGTSLLVPPSLPLTLAQSRLGRGLTSRAMKDADLDKSVAGRVVKDVGNMPITRKRSKKK
ncbi:MAG: hypothetical protein MUF01_09710 [Bryobacterales bacterium]|jgi:hypothetical protein|nr:hypothetical protein [Bryobacterales bacterium]